MKKSEKLLKKYEEIISRHPRVKELSEIFNKFNFKVYLTGGAIVDIIDDKEPKDFDLIFDKDCKNFIEEYLFNNGFVKAYESKYSSTFRKETDRTFVVQLLKTKIEDFDFTISQGKYNLTTKTPNLSFDVISHFSKVLVPTNFDNAEKALKTLLRESKWVGKGYKFPVASKYL